MRLLAIVLPVTFAAVLNASYADSCQDASLSGGTTLIAQCRNEAGQLVGASLFLDECVSNHRGQLVCGATE